jgi:hypothetical protein
MNSQIPNRPSSASQPSYYTTPYHDIPLSQTKPLTYLRSCQFAQDVRLLMLMLMTLLLPSLVPTHNTYTAPHPPTRRLTPGSDFRVGSWLAAIVSLHHNSAPGRHHARHAPSGTCVPRCCVARAPNHDGALGRGCSACGCGTES